MKTWPNLTRAVEVAEPEPSHKPTPEIERCVCGAEAFRIEVADMLGYCNRPEGQGGCEIADDATLLSELRELQRAAREVESLRERNAELLKQLEQSLADERLATANADRLTDELEAAKTERDKVYFAIGKIESQLMIAGAFDGELWEPACDSISRLRDGLNSAKAELAAARQAHAETNAELETVTQKLNKQRNAHCETMAVRDQFRKELAAARELLRQWESGEGAGRLLGEIESLSAELAAERARPRPKVLVRGAWARVVHMGAELFWRHGGVDPDELMRAGFDVEEG